MFSAFARHCVPIGILSAPYVAFNKSLNPLLHASKKVVLLSPIIFSRSHHQTQCTTPHNRKQKQQISTFLEPFKKLYRFFELLVIFMPSLFLMPLAVFPITRQIWIRIFVSCIERAGVVWIKLFQYLSHRRDVLGESMAEGFAPLRQYAPQHEFSETQKIFERVYGIKIRNFFEEFDSTPIASGSVSQVYAGKLHGKKVAIKVRHPNIENNIQRDISIVFGVSRFLTFFSRIFEIPVNEHSLKEMLTQQLYFGKQKQNLIRFNKIFENPDVCFPHPFMETTDQVLIMSFVDGKPISYYENHSHHMNKFIARIGASAFFEMLIQHNFIHADCHAGNIFVQITKQDNSFAHCLKHYYRTCKDFVWNQAIKFFFDTEILKKLCEEQTKEDLTLKREIMKVGESVKVTLLDVGMVIELEQAKRNYFINFLSQVIQGNPHQCAKMIYRISKYAGQLLTENQSPQYLQELETMFELVKRIELEKLQGIDVLSGMLSVIRNHRMKLDGEFATLLTNMLTLQAIAKDLDPNINILRCAVPYLPYK